MSPARPTRKFDPSDLHLKVYRNLSEYTPLEKAVVTVGTFDGVHIGHQKLLKRIHSLAVKAAGTSVLLTFFPHPRMVLFPDDNDLKLLTTLDEKIALLEKSGIDHLIIHPFSMPFSRTTAVEYVRDILGKAIGVDKLVIGYDHHFGRNREGSLEQLKVMAPEYGFEVEEIPAQVIDDVNVSSTKIRNAIQEGNVKLAKEFLGYGYSFQGTVVKGNAVGRSIGFPTANVKPADPHKIIPGKGVYAVNVVIAKKRYCGMANIGTRPTVDSARTENLAEVHIFDYDGYLYGEEIRVEFTDRLRDEQKFENINKLREQLEKDAANAKVAFSNWDHLDS